MKAERDQIRAREASGEMDDIKAALRRTIRPRRTRAIRAFYKRHGITPGRNLIALLFLPVMAVALVGGAGSCDRAAGGLLLDRATSPIAIRWLILPLLFGVLITLYIDLAFATHAQAADCDLGARVAGC